MLAVCTKKPGAFKKSLVITFVFVVLFPHQLTLPLVGPTQTCFQCIFCKMHSKSQHLLLLHMVPHSISNGPSPVEVVLNGCFHTQYLLSPLSLQYTTFTFASKGKSARPTHFANKSPTKRLMF